MLTFANLRLTFVSSSSFNTPPRDYITFRKSCPYGEVQCCRHHHKALVAGAGPAPGQGAGVRPVHIPVALVPTLPTLPTTTTTTTTQTSSTPTLATTKDADDIIATSTPAAELDTDTTISPSPAVTAAPVTLFSATPFTVVSSSYSVTRLEWELADVEAEDKVRDESLANIQVKIYTPDVVEATSTTTTITTTATATTTTTTTTTTTSTSTVYPSRKPVFITPTGQQPGPRPQRRPAPPLPVRHTRPLPQRVFVPHGAAPPRLPPGHAAVPGQVVFLGTPRPSLPRPPPRPQPPRRWPMPVEYLQPPPRRAGTARGHEMGFVETIGQTAINVATSLFNWGPF